MKTKEVFFDSKTIANFMIAVALVVSALYYLNNAKEIKDEVNTVIVDSLNNVNNSLAEQESSRN